MATDGGGGGGFIVSDSSSNCRSCYYYISTSRFTIADSLSFAPFSLTWTFCESLFLSSHHLCDRLSAVVLANSLMQAHCSFLWITCFIFSIFFYFCMPHNSHFPIHLCALCTNIVFCTFFIRYLFHVVGNANTHTHTLVSLLCSHARFSSQFFFLRFFLFIAALEREKDKCFHLKRWRYEWAETKIAIIVQLTFFTN